jgi:phosphatidylglycerophosphatase A
MTGLRAASSRGPSMPLVTTFGLGHMRIASGTWGSMPPVAIAGLLWLLGCAPGGSQGTLGWWIYHAVLALILIVFAGACIVQGAAAESRWGKDPGEVVADETAAQCIPLMFLPALCFANWWKAGATLAAAFLLFRILDIIKPWPAKQIQGLNAGWGILMDDIFAGLYAALILQLVARFALPAMGWVP